MRPQRNPKNPELAEAAANADADDATYWPGEALRRGGQTIDKKTIGNITEETRLPEMRNDGQLNDSGANAR